MHVEVVNPTSPEYPLPADGEDVYFPEAMAYDNRFDGLDRRLGETEKELKQINRRLPPDGFPFAEIAAQHANHGQGSWAKRNAHWFPIITPIVTVAVLVLGLFSGAFNSFFDGRINAKLDAQNGLNIRVQQLSDGIATAVGELKAIRKLWEEQLEKTSELKKEDFQRSLPKTADTLKAATILGIPTPPRVKNSIQDNLLTTNSNTPGYWSAVSQFITYQSPIDSRTLPPCLDKRPVTRLAAPMNSTQTTMEITNPTYEDCLIDLSAPVSPEQLEYFRTSPLRTDQLKFVRCKILYRGGAIALLAATPKLTFLNCIFDVATPTSPPERGRMLIASLLSTKDFAHIDFDGSGG